MESDSILIETENKALVSSKSKTVLAINNNNNSNNLAINKKNGPLYFSLNSCGNQFKDVMSFQCDRKFINCNPKDNSLELSPFLDTLYELLPAPEVSIEKYKKIVGISSNDIEVSGRLYVLKRASIEECYDEGERTHLFPESSLDIPSVFLTDIEKHRNLTGETLSYLTDGNETDLDYVKTPSVEYYLSINGFVTDIEKASILVVVDMPEEPKKKEKKTEEAKYAKMFKNIMSSVPAGLDEEADELRKKEEEKKKKNRLPFILPKQIPLDKIDLNTSILNQSTFVVDRELSNNESDQEESNQNNLSKSVNEDSLFSTIAPMNTKGKKGKISNAQLKRLKKQESLRKEASKAQWYVEIISMDDIKDIEENKKEEEVKIDQHNNEDDIDIDKNVINSKTGKDLQFLASRIHVSTDGPEDLPTDGIEDRVELLVLTEQQKNTALRIEKIIDQKMKKANIALREIKATGKNNQDLVKQITKMRPKQVTSIKWQLMPLMTMDYYDKIEETGIGVEVDPDLVFNSEEKIFMAESGYPFFAHLLKENPEDDNNLDIVQ